MLSENSADQANILANGIHIGYKKLILTYLDDSNGEIGAFKISPRLNKGLAEGSIKLPQLLKPSLDRVSTI